MKTEFNYIVALDLSRSMDIAKNIRQNVGNTAILDEQIKSIVEEALKTIRIAASDYEPKKDGDGYYLVFNNATVAVLFSEALHQEAKEYNRDKEIDLAQRHFRVGIYRGKLSRGKKANKKYNLRDFQLDFGNAKRLETACRTGEVFICSGVREDLPKEIKDHYRSKINIPGKREEKYQVYRHKVVEPAPWDQPDSQKYLSERNLKLGEGRNLFIEKYKRDLANDKELDEVVSFFKLKPDYWLLFFVLLGGELPLSLSTQERQKYATEFMKDLQSLSKRRKARLFTNLAKVLFDIMALLSKESEAIRENVFASFRSRKLVFFEIDREPMEDLLIQFAIRMFSVPIFKRVSFEFMLYYLSTPKIGGVDHRRSKIELFVYDQKRDQEVHEGLISALSSDSQFLREEAADLLGEMELTQAEECLISTLRREKNPYVARSIFNALGKLGSSSGGSEMIGWLAENLSAVTEQKLTFLLTHARRAMRTIDSRVGSSHLAEFDGFIKRYRLMVEDESW